MKFRRNFANMLFSYQIASSEHSSEYPNSLRSSENLQTALISRNELSEISRNSGKFREILDEKHAIRDDFQQQSLNSSKTTEHYHHKDLRI